METTFKPEKGREVCLRPNRLLSTFQLPEVENKTRNSIESFEDNAMSEISNNSNKRVKINDSFDLQDSPQSQFKLEDNY